MILGILCVVFLTGIEAAGFTSGSSVGSSAGSASTSSSYGGYNGNGVNYGTALGYTGSGTYGPGYPYTQLPISAQQFSTSSYPNTNYQNSNYPNTNYPNTNYPNTNYPNNFNYPSQGFQYPNQFSNSLPYQNQNSAQFQQQFPFIPYQPFPQFFAPPFAPPEYQQAFAQFQNSLQQQFASGASFAHSTPGASAYALSSLGPSNLLNHQQSWNEWQSGGGANSGPYYAPNFASATGSYGPNGIHQTASIYPPNPESPNINTRFGATGPSDGSGFFGISTSSFSSSSDVNGVKTNRKGAITSVNDNGKVTTYKVTS